MAKTQKRTHSRKVMASAPTKAEPRRPAEPEPRAHAGATEGMQAMDAQTAADKAQTD